MASNPSRLESFKRYSREYRRRNPEKIKAYNKWYRETHPEKVKALGQAYKAAHPEKTLADTKKRRTSRYGLSESEYLALCARQNGRCAICKAPLGDAANIDHNHSCCPARRGCPRCVRGVLCHPCNLLLGCAGDNTETLQRAIDYLQSFTAKASATVERII